MSVPGSKLAEILKRQNPMVLSQPHHSALTTPAGKPTGLSKALAVAAVIRVPPLRQFTDAEYAVIAALSEGLTIPAIAAKLGLAPTTVDWHAQNAAKAIPGDLLRRSKLVAWWRGATLDVLCTPAQATAYRLRSARERSARP